MALVPTKKMHGYITKLIFTSPAKCSDLMILETVVQRQLWPQDQESSGVLPLQAAMQHKDSTEL